MQLQISYQSIESSDPGINVPGPRRTVSKLRNETYHMFSNLHPGTTYLISVRARTAKGFGQTALTEITTNISGEGCVRLFKGACRCECVHMQMCVKQSTSTLNLTRPNGVCVFKCLLIMFQLLVSQHCLSTLI